MTRLALGVALAGMFCLGYFFRTPIAEPLRDFESRSVRTGQRERAIAAEPVHTLVQPAKNDSYENSADVSRLLGRVDAGLSQVPGSHTEFSKLMRSCRDVETSWKERNLSAQIVDLLKLPEDEAGELQRQALRNFRTAARKALIWEAQTSFAIGATTMRLSSIVHFSKPNDGVPDDQVCFSSSLLYTLDGSTDWISLGRGGNCAPTNYDKNSEPMAVHMTYKDPELGEILSAMIIPLDVLAHIPLKFLPAAAKGSEWQVAELNYYPLSLEELNRVSQRGPASVEK